MKEETFDQLQKRIPERIVEHAVRGMLPKGRVRHHLVLADCLRSTCSLSRFSAHVIMYTKYENN
jgi:hypothetical protein